MKLKFLVLFFCAALANALLVRQVFAISAEYQRCKSGANCTVGEFLYDDSYVPITTAVCTLTSRTPSGSLYLSSATAPHVNDGWYAYTFSTTGAVEGLYPSRLCCSVSGSTMCIDKSFNIGPSFVSSSDISNSVWNANIASNPTAGTFGGNLQNPTITAATIWGYTGRTLDSFGTLIADIWSYSTRSLTNFGTLIADVWTNSTRTLSGAALSDGGSLASANQVMGATTAVNNLSGQVAGVSNQVTGVTTSVGNLNGQIAGVSGQVTGVQTSVNNQSGQIAAVSGQVTGVQTAANNLVIQIAGTSAQISGVNTAVGNLNGQIAGVQTAVNNQSGQIAGVSGQVTGVTTAVGNLSGLPGQLAGVSGQVTGVTTSVGNLSGLPNQIAAVSGQVTGVQTASTNLSGQIIGVQTAVSDVPTNVWAHSGRTLTSFGTLIADIWAYSSRTLTSGTLDFGSLVSDIWSYSTRNLTSGTLNSGTLAVQTDVTSAASTLGTQVGGVASQVSGVTTAVSNLNGQIAGVSGQVTGVTTAVGNLSGLPNQLAAVSNQVTGVQTAVNNQVNQIAEVSNQVTGVNTAVTNVPTNVWANPTRTLSSFGTLISDIWAYTSRTLTGTVDVGSLVADVWAYSTRNLTSATLDSGSLATQANVNTVTTTLGTQIGGVASQVSGVTTAVNSQTAQIAGVSGQVTGVTTAVGNLSGLPNQIAAVSGQITGVQTSSNNIFSATNTITGQVIGASNQITGVQTSVNNQATQVAGVSGQIVGVQTAVANVPTNVWANSTRTLSSYGTLIADIWAYASRTLTGTVDVGSLVADVWAYSTRNLTSGTLNSGTLAVQTDVTTAATTLGNQVGGVASQVSGVTTAVNSQTAQIANVSTQVLGVNTAVNNLAADIPSVIDITNAVWTAAVSSYPAAGTFGGNNQSPNITAANVWASPTRTLSSFGTLISDIWAYSSRTLTSGTLDFGSLVSDIWGYSTRNLTSGTLDSGSLATQTNVNTVTTTLGNQISGISNQVTGVQTASNNILGVANSIETKVDTLGTNLSSVLTLAGTINTKIDTVDTNVDTLLAKWSTYSITDVLSYVDSLETVLGTNSNTCGNTTVFGDIKCLKNKWGSTDADTILAQATTASNTIANLRSEINYNGKSTTAYADLQTLVSGIASMQSSIGTASDSDATASVFGRIKKVQNTVETLDTTATDLSGLLEKWGTLTATDIYEKVNDVYDKLSNVDDSVASVIDLAKTNSTDVTELKNATLRMKAVVDVSRTILESTSNKPIIKTWLEEGSIIFKTLITNPSKIAEQTVPLKYYLPRETTKENIMKMDSELSVEYDTSEGAYYVTGNFTLAPGENKIVSIEVTDIWKVADEEIASLKTQSDQLSEPLKGTAYFAQSVVLKSDVQAALNNITRLQNAAKTPEERIKAFREATVELDKAKGEIASMKTLASSLSSSSNLLGSLGGIQITAVWGLIVILITGFVLLVLYIKGAGISPRAQKTRVQVETPKQEEIKKVVVSETTPKKKSGRVIPLAATIIATVFFGTAGYKINLNSSNKLEMLSPTIKQSTIKEQIKNVKATSEEVQLKDERQVLGASAKKLPYKIKVVIPDADSAINIRKEPNGSSEILTKLWINLKVNKYEEKGDWVQIELDSPDGTDQKIKGWVNKQFIEELE